MVDRPHSFRDNVNEQVSVDVATRNCIIASESCEEETTSRGLSLVFVKDYTTMALLPEPTTLMLPTDTHRNGFRQSAPLSH
jgi:hypothetical protein